jgi:DNA-binding beta-propeller fold protein YncE
MSAGKFGHRFAAFGVILTAGVGLSAAAQPAGAATQAPARPSTVTQTISVGSGPSGVAVSPQTGKIYVTNTNNESGDGTATVINGRTGRVTSTIPVGMGVAGVAVSPRTGKIYVTNYRDDTVSVIG